MDDPGARVRGRLAAIARQVTTVRRVLAKVSRGSRQAELGQGLPEYALIIALIAIVAISALIFLGTTLSGYFTDPINLEIGQIVDDILP
jgi:hypothetical protein